MRVSGQDMVWTVGALCRAVADHLGSRFQRVSVRGEISGFSSAASGHVYFSLKDDAGQLRCAMFKRAAAGLTFQPRDGDTVEVIGRVSVYEPRGDLQLVIDEMRRSGQGPLFEQFLKLKAKLAFEGLFEASRKRALPLMPRAIGLVTSLQAAALRDVLTTLRRRAPHVPVVLAPASVQGAQAPAELVQALSGLYALASSGAGRSGAARALNGPNIDVILLVRGGGSLEDLWAFNDEQLARVVAQSPVPVICGVGHETDFTIADFVADLRAPTPTAAAELVAQARETMNLALDTLQRRLSQAVERVLDENAQGLDALQQRLGRPSQRLASQRFVLGQHASALRSGLRQALSTQAHRLERLAQSLPRARLTDMRRHTERLARAGLGLGLLDPQLVLKRGFAWLSDEQGRAVTRADQTRVGQAIEANLQDGKVDLTVRGRKG